MKIEKMITEIHQKLGEQIDGRAGPETWGAIYAYIVKPRAGNTAPSDAIELVDARSEKIIATLLPEVRPIARALVQKAKQNDIQIKILAGLRTFREQDEHFALGRTKPGPKMTSARGGFSKHNFGIAFDIGVYEGSKYLGESFKYKVVGALGTDLGLMWGGNWKSIVDQPHFELRPQWAKSLSDKDMLAELRKRLALGRPVFD